MGGVQLVSPVSRWYQYFSPVSVSAVIHSLSSGGATGAPTAVPNTLLKCAVNTPVASSCSFHFCAGWGAAPVARCGDSGDAALQTHVNGGEVPDEGELPRVTTAAEEDERIQHALACQVKQPAKTWRESTATCTPSLGGGGPAQAGQ